MIRRPPRSTRTDTTLSLHDALPISRLHSPTTIITTTVRDARTLHLPGLTTRSGRDAAAHSTRLPPRQRLFLHPRSAARCLLPLSAPLYGYDQIGRAHV